MTNNPHGQDSWDLWQTRAYDLLIRMNITINTYKRYLSAIDHSDLEKRIHWNQSAQDYLPELIEKLTRAGQARGDKESAVERYLHRILDDTTDYRVVDEIKKLIASAKLLQQGMKESQKSSSGEELGISNPPPPIPTQLPLASASPFHTVRWQITITISATAVLVLVGATVAWIINHAPTGTGSQPIVGATNTAMVATATPMPAISPTATMTTPPTATIGITPNPTLHMLLQQSAPDCNNPTGTTWIKPFGEGSTSLACQSDHTILQQATGTSYGEINLLQVQGSSYNQSTFAVCVDVSFGGSDAATYAVLIAQTPAGTATGGTGLAIDPVGDWQIQHFPSAAPSVVTHGSFAQTATTTLCIMVQSSQLRATVNGQQVFDAITTDSSGVVGLLIERNQQPSIPVNFANFALQTA